jgi:hypothetical protein
VIATMNSIDVFEAAFGNIKGVVHAATRDAGLAELTFRPDAEANSAAWLIWHLTRIQDDHVSDLAGTEQVWTSAGFATRFALPFDDAATGYGQSPSDVAAVRVEAADLLAYHDAVHGATITFLSTLTANDLDRVVDEAWDPPVTLGVRLVSVVTDDLEHAGQAAYAMGLARRATD